MSKSSSVPPPEGQKPKITPPKPKPKKIAPKPQPLSGNGSLEYMGFTFASPKDLMTFRTKFLANMVNIMMAQIKRDNDRMIAALKKIREEQQ